MDMTNYISINRHKYNVREMEKLDKKILEKKRELLNTKGFWKTYKLRRELEDLFRKLTKHGTETLMFERQRAENNNLGY